VKSVALMLAMRNLEWNMHKYICACSTLHMTVRERRGVILRVRDKKNAWITLLVLVIPHRQGNDTFLLSRRFNRHNIDSGHYTSMFVYAVSTLDFQRPILYITCYDLVVSFE
jgi:hypothetical protein